MSAGQINLLTGPIGIGKTTVAEQITTLALRQGWKCGGLLAPAMRTACAQKTGIWGVDVSTAERQLLARTDCDLGGAMMGPYSFSQEGLDWATAVVQRSIGQCDLLLVDEIGKLELWHNQGLAPILPRLAAGEAARALVLVREGLLAEAQSRLAGVHQTVFRVNAQNRGRLATQVFEFLFGSG